GAERADQVLRAVVAVRGPEQHALQRAAHADRDAGAARQLRVRRGHAPGATPAGRFLRAREQRTQHHRVGAGDDRLAEVTGLLDAAIRDDRDVAAGLVEVVVAGLRAVDRGRD